SVPDGSSARRSGRPPEPPEWPAALPGARTCILVQSHAAVEVDRRIGLRSCPTPAGENIHMRDGPPFGSASIVIRFVLQAVVGALIVHPPADGPSATSCLTLFQLVS